MGYFSSKPSLETRSISLERFLCCVVCVLSACILSVLAFLSLKYSTIIPFYGAVFIPRQDSMGGVLGGCLLACLVLFGIHSLLSLGVRKNFISPPTLVNLCFALLCVWVVTLSVLWLQQSNCVPSTDGERIYLAAKALYEQDSTALTDIIGYFFLFPFQMSAPLLYSVLFRLVGSGSFLVIGYANIFCLLICITGIFVLTQQLFHRWQVTVLTLLLLALLTPLIWYVDFPYNMYPSWAVLWLAFLSAVRFWNTQHKRWLFGIALFSLFAVFLRSSNLIGILAIAILLFCQQLLCKQPHRKQFAIACFFTLLFAAALQLGQLAPAILRLQTGVVLPDGIPKIAWVTMGLQENPLLGDGCPGWYNDYTLLTYEACGQNADETAAIATSDLKIRLEEFKDAPTVAFRFLGRKTISQWCEPTFESLTTNSAHPEGWSVEEDAAPFARWVYLSGLDGALWNWQNILQTLVYTSAAGWMFVYLFKKPSPSLLPLFLAILFLGGFLFELVWEAKSRYCLEYFVMLLPYAAAGLAQAGQAFQEKVRHLQTVG